MNPRPVPLAPAPQPQVVIVQHKSGCGKAALILGIVAACIFLMVGGCFVLGLAGISSAAKNAENERLRCEKLERETPPVIAAVTWTEVADIYAINSKAIDLAREEKWKT